MSFGAAVASTDLEKGGWAQGLHSQVQSAASPLDTAKFFTLDL